MFDISGMSIAMGNAEEEVKKKSTFITKNQNENGVVYALRKYILALRFPLIRNRKCSNKYLGVTFPNLGLVLSKEKYLLVDD